MFGTSGVRGIYGKDITEELGQRLANIFAVAGSRFVIGRDIRKSGISLRDAVVKGALGAGAEVIDFGIVPTPTVALGTRKFSCRGIMITASHNPDEYNGFKLLENSKEIGKSMEKEITERYRSGSKRPEMAGGSSQTAVFDDEIIQNHKDLIFKNVDTQAIEKKKPKIVVDCNGAAAVISPQMLTDLGCRVISMNAGTEGFARPSEPNEKNLVALSNMVRTSAADYGIGHDGDGDRCVIVDETGSVLPFDVQLAMMIEHELGNATNWSSFNATEGERLKSKRVVSTVESSLTIREVAESNGSKIDITPVGSTFVADKMEENGAIFGGEPCGEYLYRNGVHVPDAEMAAAKFAEIFSIKGKFSELRTQYKQNFMVREKYPAKDKHQTVAKVKDAITIEGKIRTDDGVRVDEEDGWFLVRASGTEPIVRLTMEYKTREKLEQRKKQIENLIISKL